MARRASLTAREYLRVSVDRSGRERSLDEQHAENVASRQALGIRTFGDPYRDTGSASRHARRRRDDFARLLDDLELGRFDAELLVLWEASRGSRKTGEWVALVDACEHAGVRIAVTTHGPRVYDPANPRDRRSLLEDAVDAEYESAKTSARGKRSAAANAVAGLPHGRIPYGYRRVYDPATRRLVSQEPDPLEAPVVVEIFERVAAGHSLSAIARDLKARGVTSRGTPKVPAVPFAPQTLRAIALSPAYRGKRAHSPNRKRRSRSDRPEELYDAQWPALVPDELALAVAARLEDPARSTARPGGARHLLTMLARCDACGGPLGATERFGAARRYQCGERGCVLVKADELDAWAERRIVELLTRPDVAARLMPDPADDASLAAARTELAGVRAEHDELADELAAGRLSARLAARSEPGLLARIALAERRVADLATPAALRSLLEPGSTVAARWCAAPIEVRREIVRLLFAPPAFGVLSVARVNGSRTVEARVRLDGRTVAPAP